MSAASDAEGLAAGEDVVGRRGPVGHLPGGDGAEGDDQGGQGRADDAQPAGFGGGGGAQRSAPSAKAVRRRRAVWGMRGRRVRVPARVRCADCAGTAGSRGRGRRPVVAALFGVCVTRPPPWSSSAASIAAGTDICTGLGTILIRLRPDCRQCIPPCPRTRPHVRSGSLRGGVGCARMRGRCRGAG